MYVIKAVKKILSNTSKLNLNLIILYSSVDSLNRMPKKYFAAAGERVTGLTIEKKYSHVRKHIRRLKY